MLSTNTPSHDEKADRLTTAAMSGVRPAALIAVAPPSDRP
jgi:hypothetical protein